MRKLIALVCAIALVMALAVPAFAYVSPDWDSIDAGTVNDHHDHDDDDKDNKSDNKTETNTAATTVDQAIAASASAALSAVLNGELAGYTVRTGWLVPDIEVLKAEILKVTGTDMKVVLFSNTGVISYVDAMAILDPAFNLNGVAAVAVVAK